MVPLSVIILLLAPAQPAVVPWPKDEIQLTNGAKLRGLILEETAAGTRFRMVRRPPGQPTVTLTSFFPAGEVTAVTRMTDAERVFLKAKLAELDVITQSDRQRAAELKLTPVEWLGKPKGAWQYESDAFTLVSSADDEVIRRAAVRLEQIFTAYGRYLPPRVPTARPVTILIAPDRDEYARLLGSRPIVNPAVYDPAANRIVIGSELRTLSTEIAAARLHHGQQLAAVEEYDRRIQQLYKNAPKFERDRHLKTAADERARVHLADRNNDRKFDEATATLFALLYHETFHAYVINSVYPLRADAAGKTAAGGLPRWLNEGLAQTFETAVVDGGELRVGHADATRLDRVQTCLKQNKLPGGLKSLETMLIAGPEDYLAAHASQKETTDSIYLAAWAVTHHLTFERRLIGTKAFDDYLAHLNSGAEPQRAFATLVGKDLAGYTAEIHDYLLKLRPDGTLKK